MSIFFLEWRPRVVNYLRRGGVPAAEAEDITDEAMMRLLEKQYPLAAPIVFRIACNLLMDCRRKRARQRKAVEVAAPKVGKDCETPSSSVQHTETVEIVLKALQQLPPEQRIVVEMHAMKKVSLNQVGRVLGISREAADGRYKRGLEKLRSARSLQSFLKKQESRPGRHQGRSSP